VVDMAKFDLLVPIHHHLNPEINQIDTALNVVPPLSHLTSMPSPFNADHERSAMLQTALLDQAEDKEESVNETDSLGA